VAKWSHHVARFAVRNRLRLELKSGDLINSRLKPVFVADPLPRAGLRSEQMPIKLTVNNAALTADVPPDTPLLWVLRDILDLKGAKYGCGMGVCGACTVIVGGKAVRSCMTHVGSVEGEPITTIEGLSPDGLHPVQVAWEAIDVPQCGYCQAGQIMSAAALLARTPHPTDADIDTAMSGNVCRCGTYTRIRQAIHEAAEAGAPARAK
jgi:isoquinoline 1-oxidoreductase alpha subunit